MSGSISDYDILNATDGWNKIVSFGERTRSRPSCPTVEKAELGPLTKEEKRDIRKEVYRETIEKRRERVRAPRGVPRMA